MFVVLYLKKGDLNCKQKVYVYNTLEEAEDKLESLPAVIHCEHKYIVEADNSTEVTI